MDTDRNGFVWDRMPDLTQSQYLSLFSDARHYLSDVAPLWRWLSATALPETIVAASLWRLNRLAKECLTLGERAETYALKQVIIKHWYLERRFQVECWPEQQVLDCWDCDGTGEDSDGDWCWRCDGTGIYNTVSLFCFRFRIGFKCYTWHQPEIACPYVFWYNDKGKRVFEPRPNPVQAMSTSTQIERDLNLLRIYAAKQGLVVYGVSEADTLPIALRRDVRRILAPLHRLCYRLRRRWQRLVGREPEFPF